MQNIYGLCVLVDKYATAIEKLDLDGDQLEEYSTVLLHLHNQIETGELSDRIVNECIQSLDRFTSRLGPPIDQSSAA
jgi:hypothetical protein